MSEGVNHLLMRAPLARIADREGALIVVGADQSALQLSGDSADLARAILAFLIVPQSRAQLTSHLEELSGGPISFPEVVDELLNRLLVAGALCDVAGAQDSQPQAPPKTAAEPRTRLVLALSGAIAAAEAPTLAVLLLEQAFDLEVIMTRTARRMVSREALEAITHRRVHASLRGTEPAMPAPHIHLAAWADAVLVCPATATTLSRIARGDCSDIVSAVAISTRAPVLLVPSMNPAMYEAPSVQRNLEVLRQDGFWIAHPALGVEVAHAPSSRLPVWGMAPRPHAVLQILRAVLQAQRNRTSGG